MEINFYNSVRTSKVQGKINIFDWFHKIKHGCLGTEKIILARLKEKGSEEYKKLKENTACVTYNFLFDNTKANKNVLNATGLMYIDIDVDYFDISTVDIDYVFAYYKSFGGKGWSIIVKVDNLTIGNFKEVYLEVCKFLKIDNFIDIGAVKATQYSILSFDTEIFINNKSKNVPHSLTNLIIDNKLIVNSNRHIVNEGGTLLSLRYDNFSEITFDENGCSVDWDGINFVKCFHPYEKKKALRNNTLLSYCNNLVWLNSNATRQRILDALSSFNDRSFENPVGNDQLKRIVESVFKYKEDGTLKPIYHLGGRKILFKPEASLTKSDKLKLIMQSISEKKKRDSISKLEKIVLNWDKDKFGKISVRKISENFPVSKKTVAKYYHLFVEEISIINKNKSL